MSLDFADGSSTTTNATIIGHQTSVGTQGGYYFVGPATDGITPRNNDATGEWVHFRNDDLDEVAVAWYDAITNGTDDIFNTSYINPISPKGLMNVSVAASGSNFILTPSAPGGTTSYSWTIYSPSIDYNAGEASGTTLTVADDYYARNYRTAYFSDSDKNTRIGVPFRRLSSFLTLNGSGYRRSAGAMTEDSISTFTSVYPNPSSSDVTIALEKLDNLDKIEIVNENGDVIHNVNSSIFLNGEFETKVPLLVFPRSGFYFYRIHYGEEVITKRFYIRK